MSLAKLTAPAFAAATLKRVRENSNVPVGQDDDVLALCLDAATDYCERYLECTIATADWRLTLDSLPPRAAIMLPVWPVQSVTAIAYKDAAGNAATIAPTLIAQPIGQTRYQLRTKDRQWPATDCSPDNVVITFTAGWPDQKSIPPSMVRAILMLASHFYENREAGLVGSMSKEIEFGVSSLLELLRPEDDFAQ